MRFVGGRVRYAMMGELSRRRRSRDGDAKRIWGTGCRVEVGC